MQSYKWPLKTCLLAVVMIPCVLYAEDKPAENVWTGKGQLGYIASQGNSEAQSANAALDMALISGPWKHALHVGGVYGRNKDITASQKWDSM